MTSLLYDINVYLFYRADFIELMGKLSIGQAIAAEMAMTDGHGHGHGHAHRRKRAVPTTFAEPAIWVKQPFYRILEYTHAELFKPILT
jgi:hypothetical protein